MASQRCRPCSILGNCSQRAGTGTQPCTNCAVSGLTHICHKLVNLKELMRSSIEKNANTPRGLQTEREATARLFSSNVLHCWSGTSIPKAREYRRQFLPLPPYVPVVLWPSNQMQIFPERQRGQNRLPFRLHHIVHLFLELGMPHRYLCLDCRPGHPA